MTMEKRGDIPESLQILTDNHPELCQTEQGQADADVVDDADIQITSICTECPFLVQSNRFEDECRRCEQRFDLGVFCKT